MPKKKLKKSKKKSKSDNEGNKADLNVEDDGAQLGISKKKKGKKAKLSKEEKEKAKLAKQLQAFISDEKLYETFLQKIDKWMIHNRSKVEALFKHFDSNGEGIVTFDIFRAGLHDLHCPLTEIEIRALSKKLDPEDSGMIEYCRFERGIFNQVIDNEKDDKDDMVPEDYTPELYQTKQSLKVGLNDPFHQDFPRFSKISMRLATFDYIAKHPGHLVLTVRTHMPVSVLIKLVSENSRICGDIQIYNDKSCQVKYRLPANYTLEQCGINGGPLRDPTYVILYYDYSVHISDCPLLNCDHYFGVEKRPLNPVLAAFPNMKEKQL